MKNKLTAGIITILQQEQGIRRRAFRLLGLLKGIRAYKERCARIRELIEALPTVAPATEAGDGSFFRDKQEAAAYRETLRRERRAMAAFWGNCLEQGDSLGIIAARVEARLLIRAGRPISTTWLAQMAAFLEAVQARPYLPPEQRSRRVAS